MQDSCGKESSADLRAKDPHEWKRKVMALVMKDGQWRTLADTALTRRIISKMTSFMTAFEQQAYDILGERDFCDQMKAQIEKEGKEYDSDDAHNEFQAFNRLHTHTRELFD